MTVREIHFCLWVIFFMEIFILLYMFCLHAYVCAPLVCMVPVEARSHIPWN